MSIIIDRRARDATHENADNRKKFLDRHDRAIREQVQRINTQGSIKDGGKAKDITINPDSFEEYSITTTNDSMDKIFSGNKKYKKGDTIPKPEGKGKGNQAGDSGEGEDPFEFLLTQDEFEKYLFEDLEIPFLEPRLTKSTEEKKYVHAGFQSNGIPSNLSVIRSFRKALGRKLSLQAVYDKKIKDTVKLLEDVNMIDEEKTRLEILLKRYHKLRFGIPFIDDIDLMYRFRKIEPQPIAQGVMFCLMDVSGSMDEKRKDLAKRFFLLTYLFLNKIYKKFDVIFIAYHSDAKEVSEKEFFHGKASGGTVASKAFELANEIILARYPSTEYNIYMAHASDAENFSTDDDKAFKIFNEQLLPNINLFINVFIKVLSSWGYSSPIDKKEVSQRIMGLESKNKKVKGTMIGEVADVYHAFRHVFKKKGKK